MNQELIIAKRYKAFISYSRKQRRLSTQRLQLALERFGCSSKEKAARSIFRDESGLAPNESLWDIIQQALVNSEYLIFLASPESAHKSPYVRRELTWWLKNRGTSSLIIVLVSGTIKWDNILNDFNIDKSTAIPPCLLGAYTDEPLYVDATQAQFYPGLGRNSRCQTMLENLIAKIENIDKEKIIQLDRRYRNKLSWISWVTTSVLILLIIGLVTITYFANIHRNLSLSRRLAKIATSTKDENISQLQQSVLVAAQATSVAPTYEATQALYESLKLLGPKPIIHRVYKGITRIHLSSSGIYLALLRTQGAAEIQNTITGQQLLKLSNKDFYNRESTVRQIYFSEDDSRIATLSALGMSAAVWELPTGEAVFQTPVERGTIVSICLDQTGRFLATGHTDGSISVWQIDTNEEIKRYSLDKPPMVLSFDKASRLLAASSSMGLKTTSYSKQIHLWDLNNNNNASRILNHRSAVTNFTFSYDSNLLISTTRVGAELLTANRRGIIYAWDTKSGKEVYKAEHLARVTSLMPGPNNNYLLSTSMDATARLWALSSGKEALRIKQSESIHSMEYLEIQNLLSVVALAGNDGIIRMWRLTQPNEEFLRLHHNSNPLELIYRKNGQYLMSLSRELSEDLKSDGSEYTRYLRIWDMNAVKAMSPLAHKHTVGQIKFLPDGKHLIALDTQLPQPQIVPPAKITYPSLGQSAVSLWDTTTHNIVNSFQSFDSAILSIAYNDVDGVIAAASADGLTRIISLVDKSFKQINLQHKGWGLIAHFSADGQYLLTSSTPPELLGGFDNLKKLSAEVKLWDWKKQKIISNHISKQAQLAVDINQKQGVFAFGGRNAINNENSLVTIVNIEDKNAKHSIEVLGAATTLQFTNNGRYLVIGSGDQFSLQKKLGMTTIFDRQTQKIALKHLHDDVVLVSSISENDQYIASISRNGELWIWDILNNFEPVHKHKFESVQNQAQISFAPNSQFIAAAFGTEVKVWDMKNKTLVATRNSYADTHIWDVTFSPDGQHLAISGTDTMVRISKWRPKDLLLDVCRRVDKNLTTKEWSQYIGSELNYRKHCSSRQ